MAGQGMQPVWQYIIEVRIPSSWSHFFLSMHILTLYVQVD